jgi:hypothetical protein
MEGASDCQSWCMRRQKLMKSMGGHGSLSLLVMVKVMV